MRSQEGHKNTETGLCNEREDRTFRHTSSPQFTTITESNYCGHDGCKAGHHMTDSILRPVLVVIE